MRITLPKTIPAVCLEGVLHEPDANGVFDLPDRHAHELVRTMHGDYVHRTVAMVEADTPAPVDAPASAPAPAPAPAPVAKPAPLKLSTAADKKKA